MQTNYDIYNNISVPCVCQLILYIFWNPGDRPKCILMEKNKNSKEKY